MVNYLVNRGINVKRLVAKGYGSARPVGTNTNDEGRKLNRRIDFRIIN
jgi:outer membrane protein OmpA-like peptidoglycan-associated protein